MRPAVGLLGLSPGETADRLRAKLGTEFRVAAIGTAGEHGVRYAAIANDGRLAGRTGAGAVMGAKRLKAIAVRGSRLPRAADPRAVATLARDLATRSVAARPDYDRDDEREMVFRGFLVFLDPPKRSLSCSLSSAKA